jgi:hypothetical protein
MLIVLFFQKLVQEYKVIQDATGEILSIFFSIPN